VKYAILSEQSAAQLAARVNDYLQMGWELHGPFVFLSEDRYFYQAMVWTNA
jgi:hypothetical protein